MDEAKRIAVQPGEVLLVHRRDSRQLRREEVEALAYHLARVLVGERSAVSEWEHFGYEVAVRKARPKSAGRARTPSSRAEG